MTRSEFIRTARDLGLSLAQYAARTAGISRATIDLWSMQA